MSLVQTQDNSKLCQCPNDLLIVFVPSYTLFSEELLLQDPQCVIRVFDRMSDGPRVSVDLIVIATLCSI